MTDKTSITFTKEFIQRLREELAKRQIEMRARGVNSVSQFAVFMINSWLREHPPRLEIFNHHENIVRVKDNELNKIAEVQFTLPDQVRCSLDLGECVHIMFVLSQPDVVKVLREKGWRGPDYL
ncbi:MAG: hypothetical protein QXF97_06435 [Candidatus Caldarchaeum sp.]